jgi:pimeloyl-ACP methyl ester carboxylesterase
VTCIEVAGIRIGFERAGEGPPLVLVHGALSDSRVWRWQLDALSDEFTVVAWDAPGCGQSADPPETFRLPEYADVLAGLIAAIGLGRAHVLGHSFGGALALELARRHPELVASLILAGGYAGWAGSLPAAEVERRLAFALDTADRLPGGFAPESMFGLFSDKFSPEAAALLRTVMSESRPIATRAMAYALAGADLRDALPSIDVATLLVHGDADERSPLTVADDLRRTIPRSSLVVLPGLGHECYLEDPDRFNAEARKFLHAAR